ncbi:MAG: DUF1572 family protein, partial [Gemmatimonadaceae bacterium]
DKRGHNCEATMYVKDFVGEYGRYRALGEKAMAQVPDDALNRVMAPDGNSIAVLVRHIAGNLVSRFTNFLSEDGEKPWRNRDAEFEDGTFRRGDIDAVWHAGWATLDAELAKLTDADLGRGVTIRGQELTVHAALCRSLAHVSMHVGQIILLARMLAPGPWQTLSIPRGQSQAYNKNPALEKQPAR